MSDARLSPGDNAPDFTLHSDNGEQVTLSDLRGRKVIVYFYPAAMTPGCTKQACDFTDSLDTLHGAGYEVLGISPDKPEKLAKFRERDALTITLLSDPEGFRGAVDALVALHKGAKFDVVAGIEARGFILGGAVIYGLTRPKPALPSDGKVTTPA